MRSKEGLCFSQQRVGGGSPSGIPDISRSAEDYISDWDLDGLVRRFDGTIEATEILIRAHEIAQRMSDTSHNKLNATHLRGIISAVDEFNSRTSESAEDRINFIDQKIEELKTEKKKLERGGYEPISGYEAKDMLLGIYEMVAFLHNDFAFLERHNKEWGREYIQTR